MQAAGRNVVINCGIGNEAGKKEYVPCCSVSSPLAVSPAQQALSRQTPETLAFLRQVRLIELYLAKQLYGFGILAAVTR